VSNPKKCFTTQSCSATWSWYSWFWPFEVRSSSSYPQPYDLVFIWGKKGTKWAILKHFHRFWKLILLCLALLWFLATSMSLLGS